MPNSNELPDEITHGIPLYRCPHCGCVCLTPNDEKCNNCNQDIEWDDIK